MAELIQKQDTLNEGREKINTAITDAEQAKVTAVEADVKATQALENSESTQTQLDTIVINGDSSVEAAQARVDEKGVGHTTLKDRIDDGFTKVTSQLNDTAVFGRQNLFVDILKDMQSFEAVKYYREDGNRHNVLLENGDTFIKYQFIKDTNDDFIKLNHGKIGTISIPVDADSAQNLTGSWNTASTNHYTTAVGATFQTNTQGVELHFMHYANNQGGIWEFVIDGNENNPITISTFSHVVTSKKRSLIIKGLANVEHTVKATFKGADPLNPPSGGTARGWAYVTTSGASENTINGYGEKNYIEEGEALAEGSNKELAFRLSQGGTTYWVPDHGEGTAFNATAPKFILDGKGTDVTAYGLNQNVDINSFELVQDIYGKTPDTNNLMRIRITAKIDKSGVVDFIATMRVLENFWITAGYPAMMPTSALFNEFITSIGSIKTNNGDDSEDFFTDEKDQSYSVCAVSSSKKDLFAAIQIEAPSKTMRLNEEGKPEDGKSLYLWKRPSTPKIYFRAFDGYNIEVGEDYSWRTRYLIGKITDVYGFVKS